MIRNKRRKPSNVEEVELEPINVYDVDLQSESSVEDVESNYLGRQQRNDNTEESSFLWPANCAQRFADMSSDDGYARPYEVWPCFTEETELDVGTPFLGRRRTSLADRPLPALPSGSRNSLNRRPPIPTPMVQIDANSNSHLLLPTTNNDSDSANSLDVSEAGYADPDGPLSSLNARTPPYYNTPRITGNVTPINIHGEAFHINQSNDPMPCTSAFVRHSSEEGEQYVDENLSNTDEGICDFQPKGHQVFLSSLQLLVF